MNAPLMSAPMKRLGTKLVSLALMLTVPNVLAAETPQEGRAFDFTFTSLDGSPMPLKEFAGRVLLVVNTASFCGFTPQYKGLQALSDKYQSKGLTVIGVPSNDFGAQEPGSSEQIKSFCEGAYGITFPLTEKVVVKGSEAHPFYKWAAATLGAAPGWNFHKYLVARDGRVVASFNSGVAPDGADLTAAIEAELGKSAPTATQ